jgi:SAM-dependent methyltransferase
MTGVLMSYLRKSRERTLDRSPSALSFTSIYYSGTTYSLWRAAKGPTADYSEGLVLDAGSGRGSWKDVIERAATRESVDIAPKAGEHVTWVADLTAMPQVPTDRYDTAVCHQVLEHVTDPGAAAGELWRVLKPGGVLVVSVPHLSRQHELPYDYFRFTPGGLRQLLTAAGFQLVSVRPYGGLCTFVHHQFSTLLLEASAILYPLHLICAVLNAPFSVLSATVDRLLDRSGLLANGVIAVARKSFEENG